MPMTSPDVIVLSDQQQARLAGLVRALTSPQRLVLRARVVLLAAADTANAVIAGELGICIDTVRKWRHRWATRPEVGSLTDAHRSGRRPAFRSPKSRRSPAHNQPAVVSRWSGGVVRHWPVEPSLMESVPRFQPRPCAGRWLPMRSNPGSTGPGFSPAIPISPPRPPGYSICMPACGTASPATMMNTWSLPTRRLPSRPAVVATPHCRRAGPGQCESTTTTSAAARIAYLAAYDVHRAHVSGRCEPTTGIEPFTALVDQVMGQEPYASARRVSWIVDNGSSHRGQAAIDRLARRYPNAVMVHIPVHASWLNQTEIYFSIVQRKVVTPNDFTDTAVIEQRLADFQTCYNNTAQPFQWRFTTHDIDELLKRINQHERATPNTALAKAA